MSTRPCPQCSGAIVKKPGPGRWPKFCSAECRRESVRVPLPVAVGVCALAGCGNPLPASHAPIRFCTPKCRDRSNYERARADGRYDAWQAAAHQKRGDRIAKRVCPQCGGPMQPRQRVACVNTECQMKARNERMRKYLRGKTAEYRARGESYRGRWRTPEQRAALDLLQEDPEKRRARKQEGWHRRRAQKRTMPYEVFRHVEIYERDGWVCQLCQEPVDRDLPHTDRMSASLDHIIPLGPPHYGTHTRDNVQLAHLDCNTRKQDRLDWTPEAG